MERVYVTVQEENWAANGNAQAKAVGNGANAGDKNRTIKFDSLTDDVDDADWEVSSTE